MKSYREYKNIFLGLSCVLLIILILVAFGLTAEIDQEVGRDMLLRDQGLFFKIVNFYTKLLNTKIAVGLGFLIACSFFAFKKFWQGIFVVTSLGIGALLNFAIKNIYALKRPAYKLIEQGGFTFPSGHSNAAAALAVSLMIIVANTDMSQRTKRILTFLLSIFMFSMALTRLLLGVHYLSDVCGGLTLGSMTAIFIYALIYKYKNTKPLND